MFKESGVPSVLMSIIQMLRPLDVSPYTDEDLYELGNSENWQDLKLILAPVTKRGFAVTDAFSQALVDHTRARFDRSKSDGRRNGVVHIAVLAEDEDNGEILELLFATGIHPDLANDDGWRPSHCCGNRGQLKAAWGIFPCRPDMKARNDKGDSPLEAASNGGAHEDDEDDQHLPIFRAEVAKFIRNEGFETSFYTLAELAGRKMWFAVRNLIRRQVVPLSEFKSKYHGKTAEEWADYYYELDVAAELGYYAGLPICQLLDDVRERNSTLEDRRLLELRTEVESLKEQLNGKDKTIAELNELVAAISSRQEQSKALDDEMMKGGRDGPPRASAKKRKFSRTADTGM